MFKLRKPIAIILVIIVAVSALGMTAMQYDGIDDNSPSATPVERATTTVEKANDYIPVNSELPYNLSVAERSAILNKAISNMCTRIPYMLGLTEAVGTKTFIHDEQRGGAYHWDVGFDVWVAKTTEIWEVRADETDGFSYLYNPAAGDLIYSVWEQNENGELVEIDLDEWAKHLNNLLFEFVQFVEEFGCNCDYEGLDTFLFYAEASESSVTRNITFTYIESRRSTIGYLLGFVVTNTVPGPHNFEILSQHRVNENFPPSISAQGTAGLNAIRNGAGFTWVRYAYTARVPGGHLHVPAGRHGYVRAAPYLNTTWGTLVVVEGSMTHNIPVNGATCAVLVGSHARAAFTVHLRP